jgi:hypothetical protein
VADVEEVHPDAVVEANAGPRALVADLLDLFQGRRGDPPEAIGTTKRSLLVPE